MKGVLTAREMRRASRGPIQTRVNNYNGPVCFECIPLQTFLMQMEVRATVCVRSHGSHLRAPLCLKPEGMVCFCPLGAH